MSRRLLKRSCSLKSIVCYCFFYEGGIEGVYFDGKIDKTLTCVTRNGRQHRVVKDEEHVSVVAEPGGRYFSHLSVGRGDGESIANALFEVRLFWFRLCHETQNGSAAVEKKSFCRTLR